MKPSIIVLGALLLSTLALGGGREDAARETVRAFYVAFDQGFVNKVDFATNDWLHESP